MVGLGLTALLALPFAVIGSVLAYQAARTVVLAKSMQAWPTVPATLQHVALEDRSSNTKMVVAAYTYAIDGQPYQGTKVSLYGSDSVGGFHQRAFDELQRYVSRALPYPVHVNPLVPGDAILMPVVRWEALAFSLIFVVVLGGAGWGLLIGSWAAAARLRTEMRLVTQYPDEPWRHRVEWSTPRMRSDQDASAFGAVILAVMWNACSSPLLFAVPDRVRAGAYAGVLLLMVVPALGLGLVYWAAVSHVRARRFGNTYLHLDTFPGRQGEPYRGRILAPVSLGETTSVEITMSCTRHYRASGTGARAEVRSETLWQQKTTVPVIRGQSASGDVLLNVDLLLPEDLPDSSRGSGEWWTWQLVAEAALAGADFEAEFEVPVFKR